MPTCARAWIIGLFISLTGGSLFAPAKASTADHCEVLFSADDPALFNFVDTRKAVDFDQYAGMEIAGIETVTLPIFNTNDPKENNWLYRTANYLHIETRASTVKRQLLFEPGETLPPEKIRENERLLRDNGYLVDAMILPRKICDQRIYLLVVVRDVWTLTTSASASRTGGENKTDLGVTERNLLGSGQTLSLGYFKNNDRSGRFIEFSQPDFIGDHTRLALGYENNSDGIARNIELIRPFYELDSTWSAGLSFSDRRQEKRIESNDQQVNAYRRNDSAAGVFAGWSAGRQDGYVQRWLLGMARDQTFFDAIDAPVSEPPDNRRLQYPWLRWIFIEDDFVTLSNITHSHRNEDISVGFYHTIQLGRSRTIWNSTQNAWIYYLQSAYTASFGDHHLLRMRAFADGRYNLDNDRPEGALYQTKLDYYHFPERRNRWYASLRYTMGRNLDEDEELTSGGGNTLRGYPDDTQRGNKQWIFTAERRHFTDIHLFNLIYIGGATYIDAGKTWDGSVQQPIANRTLANIGLGLRGSPSKFNVDKVLHLDLAWPLVERDRVDSVQLIISGQADF